MNADYAAAQGAEHVLIVDLSLYPILHAWAEGAAEELAEISPDTTVTTLDPQITDLVAGEIPNLGSSARSSAIPTSTGSCCRWAT